MGGTEIVSILLAVPGMIVDSGALLPLGLSGMHLSGLSLPFAILASGSREMRRLQEGVQ